jgi:CDP-diacylglycerol--serine O-phosphatidyltransferase
MPSPHDAFDRRNTLTYLSALLGVLAMTAAVHRDVALAGIGIAAAVVADTFDGRFARLFESDARRRAIGVQLDSLADTIAFGIAPVFCSISLSGESGPLLQAAVATGGIVYAACAITRLAFFNVGALEAPAADFIGLPVPVGALIWSTILLAHPSAAATVLAMAACSIAMVAPIRIPRPTGLRLALFTCWPLAIVAAHLVRS